MKIWLLILSVSVTTINGATHEDLTRLHQMLMTNYSKDLRPTFNLSQPTTVYVGFQLISLKEFEEKKSKFAVVGMLMMAWHDFQMQWNPDDYGGIDHTFLPQSSVWKPNFVMLNPYDKIELPGFDSLNINVNHYGSMVWAPPDVYAVTCSADVTYYPFDQQTCSIYFSPYMYTVTDVILQPLSPDITLDYYYPDSLWEIKDTSCTVVTEMNSQTLALTMVLKRRPMFQVINTIVPFCILGLLNIMVFLLPAESGERIGFSVTVLLAIAVFMTIVSDTLPGTSEPSFPRLCYLLTAELCTNMLVTISTISVLRMYHKPKHQKIPTWLQSVICKCVCANAKNKIEKRKISNNEQKNRMTVSIESVLSKLPESEKVMAVSERNEEWNSDVTVKGNSDIQEKEKHICGKTSWQSVAQYLDIFLFVLFIVIFSSNKIVAYYVFS
ncbi:acetylcholine receptor subunit beta-type unc-29-like [Pecten maximus]|uniref:acetylcholine receptor subunit beta-type unc-29-like n=1 Tax=Pecten maximus TaxID=6579 RepID=UPI001458A584|nr:acetylcholine receptor subunit beta-type unc-29-like [Pecten maximus]